MSRSKQELFIEIVCGLFIFLFIYAAISKILDFEKFRIELGKSPILTSFSGIVSIVVPIFEIALAVLLMSKRLQLIALYGAFSLMVAFSCYITLILKWSSYIPCSCGGILQNMSWRQHLVFNIFFIAIAVIVILLYPNKEQDLIRDKKGCLHP